jgi:hypothetical protein
MGGGKNVGGNGLKVGQERGSKGKPTRANTGQLGKALANQQRAAQHARVHQLIARADETTMETERGKGKLRSVTECDDLEDFMAQATLANTDFTAIARRADGAMVLGSADGSAVTLAEDNTVTGRAGDFARVDAIVAQGDTAVVLDRSQTSVTQLKDDGSPGLALRAGLGATTMAADSMGRVLVADTRGGQLLVFGVDPLIQRQAYPVGGSPYGVAGSKTLVWVSLPAVNTVVGYDLATGIPVEKVRYPTVRQPNALAFDDTTNTLYAVSGAGGGVQVIRNADGTR